MNAKLRFLLLPLLAAIPSTALSATGDFIAFPGVIRQQSIDPEPSGDSEVSVSPFVDLFYSADFGEQGRVSVLAEVIVTARTHEMQRLQLGWRLNPDHIVWVGRYHTPVGYWNTEYHHGQYLQTAITRPAAVHFEGLNGIVPTHFTGLLYEGTHTFDDGNGLEIIFAAGETASFDGRLRPVDILDPGASNSDAGYVLRLGYLPDALQDDLFGLFVAQSTFEAESLPFDDIRQAAVGAFINWQWGEVRLISELMHVRNEFVFPAADDSGSFATFYAQGEHRFADSWTAFARVEKTVDAEGDPFLQFLPGFSTERYATGLRWDFKEWHAFTVELAHGEQRDGSSGELLLQWSAVLQ